MHLAWKIHPAINGLVRSPLAGRNVTCCLRAVFFKACLFLLSACSPVTVTEIESRPDVWIAGMTIRNDLPYPVTAVMIKIPATGAFAGCGNILHQSACRTSFEAVAYSGEDMLVSWKEHGQEHSTKEFALEPGIDIMVDKPVWLDVTIFAPGQAGARFAQP